LPVLSLDYGKNHDQILFCKGVAGAFSWGCISGLVMMMFSFVTGLQQFLTIN